MAMVSEEQARERLERNYRHATECAVNAPEYRRRFHEGRSVAIAQSYAEVFGLTWEEADKELRNSLLNV